MLPDPPQDLSSLTHFARDSLIWGQSHALTLRTWNLMHC